MRPKLMSVEVDKIGDDEGNWDNNEDQDIAIPLDD